MTSDPGMEEALHDTEPVCRFVGFKLGDDAVPDKAMALRLTIFS